MIDAKPVAPGLRVPRSDGRVETLAACDRAELAPGDMIVIETPGGGGYGV